MSFEHAWETSENDAVWTCLSYKVYQQVHANFTAMSTVSKLAAVALEHHFDRRLIILQDDQLDLPAKNAPMFSSSAMPAAHKLDRLTII